MNTDGKEEEEEKNIYQEWVVFFLQEKGKAGLNLRSIRLEADVIDLDR